MDGKKLFKQYYTRLAIEGVLKAFFLSLALGFVVNFVVATVLWFVGTDVLMIAVAVWAGITVIATPVLYFTVFKPDTKAIARRIDSLGYEERFITMTEFEGQDSYILNLQREDAQTKLQTITKKSIKFVFPKKLITTLCIAAAIGVSMSTIGGLSDAGILPSGAELIGVDQAQIPDYLVTYSVEGMGYLLIDGEGDPDTLDFTVRVKEGESAPTVVAVAEEGWIFDGWDDGLDKIARKDKNITDDKFIVAIFVEVDPYTDRPNEGEGDEPTDMPEREGNMPGPPAPGAGTMGQYEEKNQVVNGETYYRDEMVLQDYYNAAMQKLSEGKELTQAEKTFIQMYMDSIK